MRMSSAFIRPLLASCAPEEHTSSWLIKGNKKKGKANPDGISGRLQE